MFFWVQIAIILVTLIKFASTDSMKIYTVAEESPTAPTEPNGINSYLAGLIIGMYHCGLMTSLMKFTEPSKRALIQLFIVEYVTRHHLEYCINKVLRPSKKIVQLVGYINGCMLLLFQFA